MAKHIKSIESPKVSILITHKNGEEILDNCLASLSKTNYPNFEVFVLLNATEDRSEEIARKHKVKVYKSERNLGFAGGHNFLARKTNSKYMVIMNDDIEVECDWLGELVRFSEENNADDCQPKILSLRDKKMFEYAGAAGGLIDKYGYPFCRGRIFDKIEEDKGQYNSPARIFWASGACMMIKRELIEKIKLFDEDFFMYAEEIDFCWRVNLIGGKIFSVPSSKVYHLGCYSIKREKMEAKKEFLVHRNSLIMFLKNYSKKTILKLIIPRIFLELLNAAIFPQKTFIILKSFMWIIKNSSQIKKKHREVQNLREIDDKRLQEVMLQKCLPYLFFIKNKKTFEEVKK